MKISIGMPKDGVGRFSKLVILMGFSDNKLTKILFQPEKQLLQGGCCINWWSYM